MKKKVLLFIVSIFIFSTFILNVNADNTILFDQNFGYGLECDSPEDYYQDGVCKKIAPSNTEVSFPASSPKMYKSGVGGLLGWSESTDCRNENIIRYNETFTVSNDTTFYGCYIETVNAGRFVTYNSVADGGEEISCGSYVDLHFCKKEDNVDYCYTQNGRKLFRDKIKLTEAGANCEDEPVETKETTTFGEWRYATESGNGFSCGDGLYITNCNDNECTYSQKQQDGKIIEMSSKEVVLRQYLSDNSADAKSKCSEKKQNEQGCSKNDNKTVSGTANGDLYTICYNENDSDSKIKKELENKYICNNDNGYYFDKTSIVPETSAECVSGKCSRTYNLRCSRSSNSKPELSVSTGVVNSSGEGTIRVKAKSKNGNIVAYYTSSEFLVPTASSRWIRTNSNSFEISTTPGVLFIWVKDSDGNISDAVSGVVLDNVNTNTTINKLELYDNNGNLQAPSRKVSYNYENIKDNKYVRLSNNLSKDSNALADGFNPFDMEYSLETSSPTISVYATLTSSDSKYVDGYEPRTVNLKYGINTILIKIQNNEGKVRKYTILVTRLDDRVSDNTLNNIEVSSGKIEFNSNVTDYKIEIAKNVNTVNVKSTISSDKASYVKGYEPGDVNIVGNTTVKLIKVKSETGSTRTYVLTFVKEGTDYIEDESLQLSDLVIPGVYVPFESSISNYSFSVGYETELIDINAVMNDTNGYYELYTKRYNDNDYIVTSNKGISLDVGENFIEIKLVNSKKEESYYRLTIIRKEFGLELDNDTTLKDLKVLGYNINFKPNIKDYTVRIKQEKTLVITAVPNSNRAEVFIRGNNELTGFSTVRIKVNAENGETETYSIDIKKDAFNKTIEILSIIIGSVIIIVSSCIIIIKKKNKAKKDYYNE